MHPIASRTMILCFSLMLLQPMAAIAQINTSIGPIQSSDSLWSIADAIKPNDSVGMHQVMWALYKKNPASFNRGNINQLKKGSSLNIPSQNDMTALSEKQAIAAIKDLNKKPTSNHAKTAQTPKTNTKATPKITQQISPIQKQPLLATNTIKQAPVKTPVKKTDIPNPLFSGTKNNHDGGALSDDKKDFNNQEKPKETRTDKASEKTSANTPEKMSMTASFMNKLGIKKTAAKEITQASAKPAPIQKFQPAQLASTNPLSNSPASTNKANIQLQRDLIQSKTALRELIEQEKQDKTTNERLSELEKELEQMISQLSTNHNY